MKAYRFITGPDDATFCMKITELLNRGWELAGPATLTFDSVAGRVICGQTVVREVPGVAFSDEIDLTEY